MKKFETVYGSIQLLYYLSSGGHRRADATLQWSTGRAHPLQDASPSQGNAETNNDARTNSYLRTI